MCENVEPNEQKLVHLWSGAGKISVTFKEQLDSTVQKIVNIGNKIFLLTSSCSLHHGEIKNSESCIVLERATWCAIDIAVNSQSLFIVNNQGHVIEVHPEELTAIDTYILQEEDKKCKHGSLKSMRVSSIAVNDEVRLFVTEDGELWASGNQKQINISSEVPKKVAFFNGRFVSNVACGDDFFVALIKKVIQVRDDDECVSNEVFEKSCSECLNSMAISSISINSADSIQDDKCKSLVNDNISTNSLSTTSNLSNDVNDNDDNAFISSDDIKLNISLLNSDIDKSSTELEQISQGNASTNSETARQILTKQLSWGSLHGSAKDELQNDVIDIPTSVLKQNVLNVVQKVVTLSRNVSGSSDNYDNNCSMEEISADESKNSIDDSLQNSQSEDQIHSPNSLSLTNENELNILDSNIHALIQKGNAALATEMWTWGDNKYGQLGVGDLTSKSIPRQIKYLSHCAIKKIACGAHHALVLTLDGKVYTWGRNNFMQVAHCSQVDQKSPQLFTSNFFIHLQNNDRAKDIAAGDYHSLIMMDRKICLIGKYRSSGVMSTLDIPNIEDHKLLNVFCSDSLSCCTMKRELDNNIYNLLVDEQIYLEEILCTYQKLIIPFQKKSGARKEFNEYETLCQKFINLLSLNILYVENLWDCDYRGSSIADSLIIKNAQEFLIVYKRYLNAVCDVLSLGGFSEISQLINVFQELVNIFQDRMKKMEINITNEAIIEYAFHHPLSQMDRHLNAITSIINGIKVQESIEKYQQILNKYKNFKIQQEKLLKIAEDTKRFWEGHGKVVEQFRTPERRIIRESRSHLLTLHNASRFSSHWFLLLSDLFIHINGNSYKAHPLCLVWIDLLPEGDPIQNAFLITTPEETLTLITTSASERGDWFHAFQNAIKGSLKKSNLRKPPQMRTGSFTFVRHPIYKDAIYTGQWMSGKLQGTGKLEWADNRMYSGQFDKGVIQGMGRMEMPLQGVYEGQWKDGHQNGYGVMNYINGDIYEGFFKDGLPHGHGSKKEGHFMASAASLYIGDWSCGVKHGYGVLDDIKTGEKYLGSWINNSKHGTGLLVTVDGIYYEGIFVQDIFQGHGIMVLEDGMHYEGEFKSIGVFGGKGILTFSNKEILEGNFSGNWKEGIKISATLRMLNKNVAGSNKPKSFGKLCCQPDQKWKSIFHQFYISLGVPEIGLKTQTSSRKFDLQRLWQNVAAVISKSQRARKKNFNEASGIRIEKRENMEVDHDQLNKILYFNEDKLSFSTYEQIHKYLMKAFESPHHPLGMLISELANVYTASYGGVRVHPLLLDHAVSELRSVTTRVYDIVTLFFPQLPKTDEECILHSSDDSKELVISGSSILHPILLPRVYSALFILYALHNKKSDDAYWERLIKWNKQPHSTLLPFLGVDEKFWKDYSTSKEDFFLTVAIETLQQLKTTFSAVDKLTVIRRTHHKIEKAIQVRLENYKLPADELIPIFYFVVVRASILQLGSEINFIKDFMESYLMNGQYGYAFTTLMGIYDHILNEKISMDL